MEYNKKRNDNIKRDSNEWGDIKEDVQTELLLSTEEIKNIFDKTFKKCITLSAKAVVRLINGIFGTEYPDDSSLVYNWTEFVKDDKKMGAILADCIVTVNGEHAYHMEAQAYYDNEVVFRVFDYGYEHAKRGTVKNDNRYIMKFPKPVVIYLYYEHDVPEEYILELEFDEGNDSYVYKVPVIKLPSMSAGDMDRKNMVILIPFKLLKLREWVYFDKASKTKRMTKTAEELKDFIENDIISTINTNRALGNITDADAVKLKQYTLKLCEYICDHLGAEGLEEVRNMTDHSFMTEADIICEKLEIAVQQLEDTEEKLGAAEEKLEVTEEKLESLQKQNDDLQEQLKAYKEKFGNL